MYYNALGKVIKCFIINTSNILLAIYFGMMYSDASQSVHSGCQTWEFWQLQYQHKWRALGWSRLVWHKMLNEILYIQQILQYCLSRWQHLGSETK